MRKLILTISILQLLAKGTIAQAPTYKHWDSRFGGNADEQLVSFQQTTDGGFVIGGYTTSNNGGDVTQLRYGAEDFWILKIDSLGRKQWDKRLGGDSTDILTALKQTADGGYIAGGYSYSGISGDVTQTPKGICNFWIVKLSPNGTKQWDKRFGGTYGYTWLYSLDQTQDGGYILGGTVADQGGDISNPNIWGGWDNWIIKTDSLGNKQWDEIYGGDWEENYMFSLYQTTDGGYMFACETQSDAGGCITQPYIGFNSSTDIWVVKLSSTGTIDWNRRYGGYDDDYLTKMIPTNDGGYLLGVWPLSDSTGDITQPMIGAADIWLLKVNTLNQKQWNRRIGTYWADYITSVSQTMDGGYLISSGSLAGIDGDKTEANLGYGQTWLVKTDSSGLKLWDKTLFTNCFLAPYTEGDFGQAIEISNGCYVIANMTNADTGGYKSQGGRGGKDFWIIKMCTTPFNLVCNSFFTLFPDSTQGLYYGYNQSIGTNLSYLWDFGDGSTSTQPFPDHVYAGPGHYNVCLTVNNGAGCVHTYCDSSFYVFKTEGGLMSHMRILDPTGIQEINGSFKVIVFPNPFSNQVTFKLADNEQTSVTLYNFLGQQILKQTFTNSTTINTEQMQDGIYFYELKSNKGTLKTGKLVKQ